MRSCWKEYWDNLSFIYLSTNITLSHTHVSCYEKFIFLKIEHTFDTLTSLQKIPQIDTWFIFFYITDDHSSCQFNFENHSSIFPLEAFNISTMLTMISRILAMTAPSTIWSTTIFNAITGIWKRWIPRNWIRILFSFGRTCIWALIVPNFQNFVIINS